MYSTIVRISIGPIVRRFVVADAATGTLRYYKSHPTITFAKYRVTEKPKGEANCSNTTYWISNLQYDLTLPRRSHTT